MSDREDAMIDRMLRAFHSRMPSGAVDAMHAALAVAEAEIRADERERCAKIAEGVYPRGRTAVYEIQKGCCCEAQEQTCEDVARKIREGE